MYECTRAKKRIESQGEDVEQGYGLRVTANGNQKQCHKKIAQNKCLQGILMEKNGEGEGLKLGKVLHSWVLLIYGNYKA